MRITVADSNKKSAKHGNGNVHNIVAIKMIKVEYNFSKSIQHVFFTVLPLLFSLFLFGVVSRKSSRFWGLFECHSKQRNALAGAAPLSLEFRKTASHHCHFLYTRFICVLNLAETKGSSNFMKFQKN
jgi:hypothetical protein